MKQRKTEVPAADAQNAAADAIKISRFFFSSRLAIPNYNLNQLFIRYSSQSVCGIKPANLFTVPSEKFTMEIFREWQLIVNEQGLDISAFKISDRTTMLFIYNKKWIQKIIENPLVVSYLGKKGYSSIHDTSKTIQDLSNRLRSKKISLMKSEFFWATLLMT